MIKPTELRLGNWIKKYESGWDFKQVTASDIAELEATPPHAEDMRFQPILLTGEVLERCGFVFDHDIHYRVISEELYIAVFTEDNLQQIGLSGNRANNVVVKKAPAIYLHQLQNLFHVLAGEELQINL